MTVTKQNQADRNPTVDLLRCIGLCLVIAAHCTFPDWFYEFRTFDVVLLFVVSGMSYRLSAETKRSVPFGTYAVHRFRRLILPVWIFLAGFFLLFFLLGHGFETGIIVKSFALLSGGILFVWVFRVFFLTSLLNPVLLKWAKKIAPLPGCAVLLAGILLNDGLYSLIASILPGAVSKIWEVLAVYTAAYALTSFGGMLFIRAEKNERLGMLGITAAAAVTAAVVLHFPPVSESKYPPAFFYCMYGLAMSFLLYLLLERIHFGKQGMRMVRWLSVQSMNVYMWHILFFYLLETFAPDIEAHAMAMYAILLCGGILGAALQARIGTWIGERK